MGNRLGGIQSIESHFSPMLQFSTLMRGLQRRTPFFVLGFCLSILSITIFNTRLFAQSTGTVTIDPATTQLSDAVEDNTATNSSSVTLTATANPDPSGLSWTWSGPSGGAGTAVLSSTGPSNSTTATIYFTTAGAQNWQVSASASGTSSGGPTSAGPGSATISVNVIGVESISLKAGTKHYVGKTLSQSDFDITTNPAGFESHVSVTNVTPSPGGGALVSGDNTFSATCGTSQKQCVVQGVDAEVTSDIVSADLSYDGYTFTTQFGFSASTSGDDATYSFSGAEGLSATGMSSGTISDGGSIPLSVTVTQTDSGGSTGQLLAPADVGLAGISDISPTPGEILADGGFTFFVIVTLVVLAVSVSGCSSSSTAKTAPDTSGLDPIIQWGGKPSGIPTYTITMTSASGDGSTATSACSCTAAGQKRTVAATGDTTKTSPKGGTITSTKSVGSPAPAGIKNQAMSVTAGAPSVPKLKNAAGTLLDILVQAGIPAISAGYQVGPRTATWTPDGSTTQMGEAGTMLSGQPAPANWSNTVTVTWR